MRPAVTWSPPQHPWPLAAEGGQAEARTFTSMLGKTLQCLAAAGLHADRR